MVANLRFYAAADEEFAAAALWYEQQVAGLGDVFENAVDLALASIIEAPERQPFFEAGCRRWPLRRFPYSIVYLVEGEDLWIVAVAHERRRPGYWADRLA